MRKFLSDVLSSSAKIEVIATAMDHKFAAQKIKTYNPDVVILDTDITGIDGIDFLDKIMSVNPMPVIMVSNNSADSAQLTIKSLELGAIDFIVKPGYSEISNRKNLMDFSERLIRRVLEAEKSNVKKHDELIELFLEEKTDQEKIISNIIIAIGASAGGVQIIGEIIKHLPINVPGIIISQHMPEAFTKAFADSLNNQSKLYVKELDKNERIYRGSVYIAPGKKHIVLKKDNMGYVAALDDSEPVNRHKPSVDVMFYSVAEVAGKDATGILLTGMGEDGARGLLDMKESGSFTIAQDKESSIVFGMPAKAIKIGAADEIMNTREIIDYLYSKYAQ